MSSYPVETDIDAEQIVRWLLLERQRGGPDLDIEASRFNRGCPIETTIADRFGDEECEDLRDERTVARLKITPAHARDGWRIVITVEADLEPIDPDEARAEEERQPIDLDTFFLDYIRPRHATASVVAEVESPAAHLKLDQLLNKIATDIHVPEGQRPTSGKAA